MRATRARASCVVLLAIAGSAVTASAPAASFATTVPLTTFLTATNGSDRVTWADRSRIDTNTTLTDGSWSPDGSRLVFVNTDGDIETVRYDDGGDTTTLVSHTSDTAVKSHPIWFDNGAFIVWSEKLPGQAATLAYVPSLGGATVTLDLPAGFDYTQPAAAPSVNLLVMARRTDDAGTPTGPSDIYKATWDVGGGPAVAPTLAVANATSPAVDVAGVSLAWVRSDGVHTQIFTSTTNDLLETQITADLVNHDNPAWSPDPVSDTSAVGTIAFDEGIHVFTAADDGSQRAAPVSTTLSGVPAWEYHLISSVFRLSGADRYRTATAVSAFEWPQLPNEPVAQTVVLVRSDTFADALAGSALAAAKHGPLLLTASGSLNPVTKAEIIRLLPPNATVYLLGGTAAISVGVAATITGMGYHVVRLGGANRYATATLIADAINPHPATVLAATGLDFPDALSAGAAAGSMDLRGGGATVVLTAGGVLPADTKTYLNRLEAGTNPPHITAIGGESVPATAGYPSTSAVVGSDRYETSRLVATAFFPQIDTAELATGANWPDALAGGAVGGPLVLSRPAALPATVDDEFDVGSGSIDRVLVIGGSDVVTDAPANAAGTLISGPDGYDLATNPPPCCTTMTR